MWQLLAKGVISGAIVVGATEVARRSTAWGAVLVSLPLTSILALAWLYAETRDTSLVSELSWSILWVVLPSVVLFVALPVLLGRGMPFPLALPVSCGALIAAYAGYVRLLGRFGVDV